MIQRRLRIATLAVAALHVVSGCSGDAGGSDIPIQEAQLVEQGEALFEANCASCHGADTRGTSQGPSLLSEVYEPNHHGDGAFLLAVQRGSTAHHWNFGNMPPIQGLTPQDVEAIVAFVRELQRVYGFEDYPP